LLKTFLLLTVTTAFAISIMTCIVRRYPSPADLVAFKRTACSRFVLTDPS